MTKKELLDAIHGQMIISCQAVKGEPLYVEEKSIMYLMARAAKQAGTPAIRTSSIRDVIAFPKVKDASCLMSEAPNVVDEKQLKELCIKVDLPEETTEEK